MVTMMIRFLLSSLLCGASLVAGAGTSHLRSPLTLSSSVCNEQTTQESCFQTVDEDTNQPCMWCSCQAIPSECLTRDQAAQVPEGVFDCTSPSFVFEQSTWTIRSEEPKQEDICDGSSKSMAGYVDISGSEYDPDKSKHLFFWMFEKRNQDTNIKEEDIPFVVWLTGGPGCSSTLALLSENGPCSVNKDGETTSLNPYSWTEAAHVLWLDQPAGVGFSYGDENDYNEKMVSEDAYYFLQTFMQTYTKYSNNPLFIFGESYGGHYAPAIAHRVWKGNQQNKDGTIQLNLAGLAVGNGLTDPEEQYKWYPEMAYNNSHHLPVISEQEYNTMASMVPKCTSLIHECNKGDSTLNNFACQTAFVVCNTALTSPYQMTGRNPYDIRKMCGSHPLCYDFSNVEKWLNLDSTKQALNVNEHSHSWEACNMGINLKFHTDWMKDFSGFVADLLNDDIPVLIYAGDVDFICNYLGNKAWTYALDWKGGEDFRAAPEQDWRGQGLVRSYGGLSFLQVYDAGHMVPSDQPEVSLDMLKEFLGSKAT